MSIFKNNPPLVILIFCICLLGLIFNKPFIGHHDFNSVYFSQIARNLISYSPFDTKLGQILGYGYINKENFNFYTHNVPLYPWMLSLSFLTFGVGEWQARIISIIASVFSTIIVYRIALLLFNKLTAYLSLLLFTLSAMMIYFSNVAFPDPLAMFFTLGTFYFYLDWIYRKNSISYYLLTFFLTLSLLTLWGSYFLPPLIFLHYLFVLRGKNFKQVLLILFLPFVVFAAHTLHVYLLTGNFFGGGFFDSLLFRLNLSKDDLVKFSVFQFIHRETSLVFAYYSKITVFLVLGWFSVLLYRMLKRYNNTKQFTLLILFFWGISYPLVFIQGAFVHDYFLIYIAPFIAIASGQFLDIVLKVFKFPKFRRIPTYLILFIFPLIQFFMIKNFAFALLRSNANSEGYSLAKMLNFTKSNDGDILVLSGQFGAHFDVFTNFYVNRDIRYADFDCQNFSTNQPYLDYKYVVYIYKRQDTPLCTLKILKGKYASFSNEQFEIFKINND